MSKEIELNLSQLANGAIQQKLDVACMQPLTLSRAKKCAACQALRMGVGQKADKP